MERKTSPDESSLSARSHEFLNGWKEIATYVGRGVRTVQRWESLGLPVRRPKSRLRSAVVSTTHAVDAWLASCGNGRIDELALAAIDSPGAQDKPGVGLAGWKSRDYARLAGEVTLLRARVDQLRAENERLRSQLEKLRVIHDTAVERQAVSREAA